MIPPESTTARPTHPLLKPFEFALNRRPAPAASLAAPAPTPFHIRLQATRGWSGLRLNDLWAYRELLFFFTWRDIKVRYKQTALGAAWAIIQPLFTMVIFSFFFGKLAKMPSDGLPYPIWSYAGLVPWTFFASGLSNTSNSLVQNSNLIKKVYFPRLALPIATIFASVVDFLLASTVLLGMMFYFRVVPTVNVVFLPLFFLLALVTALGVSLWVGALNVKYRDVKYVLPFIVQFWMFASPVVYSSTLLSEPWRTIYGLNPMVGVLEGFRWALLGADTQPGPTILLSALASIAIFIGGLIYFQRTEKTFADVI